jgi:hypothetical protein
VWRSILEVDPSLLLPIRLELDKGGWCSPIPDLFSAIPRCLLWRCGIESPKVNDTAATRPASRKSIRKQLIEVFRPDGHNLYRLSPKASNVRPLVNNHVLVP